MNERSSIMKPVAVIDAVRTPFAKSFGVLANVSAVELGETAVRAVLERSGVAPDAIDEVIIGNVSPPADAANPARVIALKAGIPESKIAHTVNRNCASGMQSIISGIHSITLGQAEVVIAGGT